MFGLHPFFDVAEGGILVFTEFDLVGVGVEVVAEMLEQGHFFLKLSFLRVLA